MGEHKHGKKSFKTMALKFAVRDILSPPKKTLKEIDIRKGSKILDFGAGTGSFSIAASKITGATGKVYAMDSNPESIAMIEKKIGRKSNIKTIQSDCDTGLPEECMDFVIMYDVLHHLSEPVKVLTELNRILKQDGKMTFSDHHMDDESIRKAILRTNLFDFVEKRNKTYTFKKI